MSNFGKYATDNWGTAEVSLDDYPFFLKWFGYSFWIFGILGLPIYYSIQFLASGWVKLPTILATTEGKIGCSAAVVIIGFICYLIRSKLRFLYASVELSTASMTAFYTSHQLSMNGDRFVWLLSMVGALYISVRAFDNFSKWKHDRLKSAELLLKSQTNTEKEDVSPEVKLGM